MVLDPQIAGFLLGLRSSDGSRPATPEAFRADTEAFFSSVRPTSLPEVESIVDQVIVTPDGAQIRARYYGPTNPGETTILYFHGGGWTTGSIETHDEIARALARDTRCGVVSLDYRLAPENTFPKPLRDCLAAWRWVMETRLGRPGATGRFALAGDSSGGNLAAALSLHLRDNGLPGPLAQLLIYPVLDLTLTASSRSMTRFAEGYWLEAADTRLFVSYYTPDETDRADPLASPLRASSHAGLPPTMIVSAGCDPIYDDATAYANRLVDAGATVMQLTYGGLIHGFIEFAPDFVVAMEARTQAFRHFGVLIRECERSRGA